MLKISRVFEYNWTSKTDHLKFGSELIALIIWNFFRNYLYHERSILKVGELSLLSSFWQNLLEHLVRTLDNTVYADQKHSTISGSIQEYSNKSHFRESLSAFAKLRKFCWSFYFHYYLSIYWQALNDINWLRNFTPYHWYDSIEDHLIEEKFNKTSNLLQIVKKNIIGNRRSYNIPRNHFLNKI